jgi:hypothetical protein
MNYSIYNLKSKEKFLIKSANRFASLILRRCRACEAEGVLALSGTNCQTGAIYSGCCFKATQRTYLFLKNR